MMHEKHCIPFCFLHFLMILKPKQKIIQENCTYFRNNYYFCNCILSQKAQWAERVGVNFMEWSVYLRSSLTNCKLLTITRNSQKMRQW